MYLQGVSLSISKKTRYHLSFSKKFVQRSDFINNLRKNNVNFTAPCNPETMYRLSRSNQDLSQEVPKNYEFEFNDREVCMHTTFPLIQLWPINVLPKIFILQNFDPTMLDYAKLTSIQVLGKNKIESISIADPYSNNLYQCSLHIQQLARKRLIVKAQTFAPCIWRILS